MQLSALLQVSQGKSEVFKQKILPDIAEALELLFVISHNSLDAQIQSEWNGKLKFTSTFNSERAITRREFALLLDTYLNPFDMKVDITGKLIKKN